MIFRIYRECVLCSYINFEFICTPKFYVYEFLSINSIQNVNAIELVDKKNLNRNENPLNFTPNKMMIDQWLQQHIELPFQNLHID